MHSGFAQIILNKASIEGEGRYVKENPISFIWFALLQSVTQLSNLILLKLVAILIPLIAALIMYCSFDNKHYSLITAVSFIGLFFIDQGHYSPQALALIYILLVIYVWLSQYRRVKDKKSLNISYSILFILGVGIIIFTNPTSSLAIILILFFYAIFYSLFTNRYSNIYSSIFGNSKSKSLSVPSVKILLFSLILFITWLLFIGQFTLNQIIFRVKDLIANIVSPSVSSLAIKTNTSINYFYFNLLQYAVALSTLISGCIMIYFYRMNLKYNPIGPSIFILFILILPITLFRLGEDSSTFLQRTYMYSLIGWSITIGVIFVRLSHTLKYSMIIIIVFSILILPITRYGGDFAHYVPSSLLYVSNFLIKHSINDSAIITSSTTIKHPFIYAYHENNNYNTNINLHPFRYYDYKTEKISYKINHIIGDEIHSLKLNVFIVIAEQDSYKYTLINNDPRFIYYLKEELNNNNNSNKIIDFIYQKIYSYKNY